MKIVVFLIASLCAFQLHAVCNCTCDPKDLRLCEPSYDLDHPCGVLCPSQSPAVAPGTTSIAPPRMACPIIWAYNPVQGVYQWRAVCVE